MGQHEAKTRLDGRAHHFEVRSAPWEPEDDIGAAFAHAFGQYLRQPVTHSDRRLFHLRVATTIGTPGPEERFSLLQDLINGTSSR
jgi:hypothetical protein